MSDDLGKTAAGLDQKAIDRTLGNMLAVAEKEKDFSKCVRLAESLGAMVAELDAIYAGMADRLSGRKRDDALWHHLLVGYEARRRLLVAIAVENVEARSD